MKSQKSAGKKTGIGRCGEVDDYTEITQTFLFVPSCCSGQECKGRSSGFFHL